MGSDGNEVLKNFMAAITKKINDGDRKITDLFSKARIYKVPEDLRELNKSAYTPRVIAIGPLHREDQHLQKHMEHVKRHYTHHLLARPTGGISLALKGCAEEMKKYVDRARECYAAELTMCDDQVAEMMLFDGCFILELLFSTHRATRGDSGNSKAQQYQDPILDCILTANIVKHDLLLFENQIPFFVLEELFKLTVNKISENQFPGGKKLSLKEYVVWYFGDIMSPPDGENSGSEKKTCCCTPWDYVRWVCGSAKESEQEKKDDENSGSETKTGYCSPSDCVLWVSGSRSTKKNEQGEKEPGKVNEYYHILHLLHEHYLPVPGNQGENSTSRSPHCCTIPGFCASDLDYAGVKFEAVNFGGSSLFDVKFEERNCLSWLFHRATFKIPTLNVHGNTEPFFRNLIALEQCCPQVSRHFTSYAKLIDMLINSEKDVQVLKKAKVIHNYLGTDKDVSDMFNKLCKEVVLPESCFKEACQKASKYSDRCWPRFRARFTRRYLASPWARIGFCLVVSAFLIQIASLVFSILK